VRQKSIQTIVAVWNAALSVSVVAILVGERVSGSGIYARSSFNHPFWLLTLVYALTMPVTSLAGVWLCIRADLPRARRMHLVFFLLWMVLLVGTFVVRQ
jgi:hypothetical protein